MGQTINFDDLGGKKISTPGQIDFSDLEAPPSEPVPSIIANASQPAGAPHTVRMDDRDLYQQAGDAVENTVTNLGVGAAKSAFGTAANAGRFSDFIMPKWLKQKFGV